MLDKDPKDLQTTVQTNLVGAMLVTKVCAVVCQATNTVVHPVRPRR